MPAPVGNKFWKMRTRHGRNPVFDSPEDMWAACCEYFEWVQENPLEEEQLFAYQGNVSRETVYKMQAMTIEGMCVYLGIGTSTWSDYKGKEGFSAIANQVESVIRTQKITGAAADQLNQSIIAREVGLAEKKDYTSSDGSFGRSLNDFYTDVVDDESPAKPDS